MQEGENPPQASQAKENPFKRLKRSLGRAFAPKNKEKTPSFAGAASFILNEKRLGESLYSHEQKKEGVTHDSVWSNGVYVDKFSQVLRSNSQSTFWDDALDFAKRRANFVIQGRVVTSPSLDQPTIIWSPNAHLDGLTDPKKDSKSVAMIKAALGEAVPRIQILATKEIDGYEIADYFDRSITHRRDTILILQRNGQDFTGSLDDYRALKLLREIDEV